MARGARQKIPFYPTNQRPSFRHQDPIFFNGQDDKLVFSTSSALRARILMVNAVPDNDLWNR